MPPPVGASVNWDQLKTILWLRWRLTVNQVRRQGRGWAVIVAIIFWLALITAVSSFFVSLSFGVYLSSKLGPDEWMYVWDGILLGFLGFWLFGVLIELQQSELLSLHKLLHLPISLSGTFVCNYLTSLISISVALFVPIMAGLAAALIATKGAAMLVLPPLILTFVMLLSTLTYQFQGWLATMMLNPRRRRAVIATVSLVVIVGAQLPNLVNMYFQRTIRQNRQGQPNETDFTQEFNIRVSKGEAKQEQFPQQLATFREEQGRRRQAERDQLVAKIRSIVATINAVLPIGWLAYGAKAAAEGNIWPGLLGSCGAAMISAVSLRRSYGTALRLYTGVVSSSKRATIAPSPAVQSTSRRPKNLVEWPWPGVSEHAAAIAWTSIRSLSRAPEVRLVLIGPLIAVVVVCGLIFAHGGVAVPAVFRPLITLGAMCGPLLGVVQLLQNQFGTDRSGFRALVLTAAPRREILLGKNLSLAPLVLGLGAAVLIGMQFMLPLPASHFVALLLQLQSTFWLYCLVGNMVSIWFPAVVASGSLKPASANTRVIVAQVIFGLMFPVMFVPALGSYALHVLAEHLLLGPRFPTFLLLSAVEALFVAWVYRRALGWQGRLLEQREQIIAQAVAARSE